MYTLISGSPKPVNSNSLYFLKRISLYIDKYKIYELKKDKYEEIIDNIRKSEVIVFAFPLYVDSPTSIMLKFLDYLMDKNIMLENKLVYVVVNCGFREGEQNITGLNIIKRWCSKMGALYQGAILIGAGEIVGKDEYRLVSRRALRKLKLFSKIVNKKQKSSDIITTMDILNNRLYCYLANLSWNKKCKLNKLSGSDIRIK